MDWRTLFICHIPFLKTLWTTHIIAILRVVPLLSITRSMKIIFPVISNLEDNDDQISSFNIVKKSDSCQFEYETISQIQIK